MWVMNSYYSPELVRAMHREMLEKGARSRELAVARRQQKARRLTRKAEALATRAAELVKLTHR